MEAVTAVSFNSIGLDGTAVCEACGAVVAQEWRPEHIAFHEAVGVPVSPATPANAKALEDRLEAENAQLAWLHQCGRLNRGHWFENAICGCRFSVEHAYEVEGHYRLVPVEGLPQD